MLNIEENGVQIERMCAGGTGPQERVASQVRRPPRPMTSELEGRFCFSSQIDRSVIG
jgi:hypothetical protein